MTTVGIPDQYADHSVHGISLKMTNHSNTRLDHFIAITGPVFRCHLKPVLNKIKFILRKTV
jgi:hypothetical protein